jgi:hypothetical protein
MKVRSSPSCNNDALWQVPYEPGERFRPIHEIIFRNRDITGLVIEVYNPFIISISPFILALNSHLLIIHLWLLRLGQSLADNRWKASAISAVFFTHHCSPVDNWKNRQRQVLRKQPDLTAPPFNRHLVSLKARLPAGSQ